MSTLEVKKCSICGKLFQSLGTNVCAPCSEQVDKDFLKIREYIYDTSGDVDVKEIMENTGVAEKTILYLLKEGRLSEKNVTYKGDVKCAVCGKKINSGKLCAKCSAVWGAESKKIADAGQRNANIQPEKAGNRMYTRH